MPKGVPTRSIMPYNILARISPLSLPQAPAFLGGQFNCTGSEWQLGFGHYGTFDIPGYLTATTQEPICTSGYGWWAWYPISSGRGALAPVLWGTFADAQLVQGSEQVDTLPDGSKWWKAAYVPPAESIYPYGEYRKSGHQNLGGGEFWIYYEQYIEPLGIWT
jgi:hypothetical protein